MYKRQQTCGARRVARRALLALAGSKRAYRAARDAATLSVMFDSLARAALPAPGAWFEQRAPYAALLEASSCLASASGLAAARPESWRRVERHRRLREHCYRRMIVHRKPTLEFAEQRSAVLSGLGLAPSAFAEINAGPGQPRR